MNKKDTRSLTEKHRPSGRGCRFDSCRESEMGGSQPYAHHLGSSQVLRQQVAPVYAGLIPASPTRGLGPRAASAALKALPFPSNKGVPYGATKDRSPCWTMQAHILPARYNPRRLTLMATASGVRAERTDKISHAFSFLLTGSLLCGSGSLGRSGAPTSDRFPTFIAARGSQ